MLGLQKKKENLAFSNQSGEGSEQNAESLNQGLSGAVLNVKALKSTQNRHPGSPSTWKIRKLWIQHFRSSFALKQSSFHHYSKQ